MEICVIGAGYVGLVTAACLSKIGHTVSCVERDRARVKKLANGECPIYEPGLASIIKKSMLNGSLRFTYHMQDGVQNAKAIFVAVGTPSREDGSSDISQVLESAEQAANFANVGAVIITKSTVPVGTNRAVQRVVYSARPDGKLTVASNPEFLREGSAVKDFEEPDRIVIGFKKNSAGETLRKIYKPLTDKGFALVQTSCENAEMIKYASNAFLALKVTFANELSDLCEALGGDMKDVALGLGLDGRIGPKFLKAGPGYGGSCFPKDTRAMAHMGRKFGARQTLVETVIERNEARKLQIARRILAVLGSNAKGKSVCIWGIAFKEGTDDIRDAPAITIIKVLENMGVNVRAHDPEAMGQARHVLPKTQFFSSPEEAAEGTDLIAILTGWESYKRIDFDTVAANMKGDTLMDFRNILPKSSVKAAGLRIISIGSSADNTSHLVKTSGSIDFVQDSKPKGHSRAGC